MGISIITSSYNQGRFIERTIRSVLAQGIAGLEYIVVDGGSTDNTLQILHRYDGKLRWVSEKDKGQADAINKGIKMTKHEIIGWLNSDDVYYPGALSTVLSCFEEHPEVEVIYGDADHIDVDDSVIEPYYTEDWDYERLKEICFLCQPAVFFRRRLTQRAGLLDDNLQYCMDYEYWLRLGVVTPFLRIDPKLAGSRMYENNKTLGASLAVHREINDMLFNKFGYIPFLRRYGYAHTVARQKGCDFSNSISGLKYIYYLLTSSFHSYAKWKQTLTLKEIWANIYWSLGLFKKIYQRSP